MLFYDLTDIQSFKNTIEWLGEIKEHAEENIIIMLIGNKVDLIDENPELRKVQKKEVLNFCKKNLYFTMKLLQKLEKMLKSHLKV